MDWGVRITNIPSLLGSLAATSNALEYLSGLASPMISTGLLWLQTAGRSWLNASIVSGDNSVSSPPLVIKASVAKTPGPPALVKIVKRRPLGRGCFDRTSAI